MAASINDKFTEATNGSRPVPTTLTALLPSGASPGTATCGALTGWPTATAVHFIIYTVDVNGNKVSGSQTDWKGVVSGSTITGLVLKAGTNNGYAIGAIVEAAPTAAWADDVTEGIMVEHNQNGTHAAITATSLVASGNSTAASHISTGDSQLRSISLETIHSQFIYDFVFSGGVWTGDSYGSTRAASMTAAVVYLSGRRVAVSAVTARTFTASKDTYIDVDNTGTITYTEVANNAASPALTAGSIRIGIIITAAGSIANVGSINQGEETKLLPIASSQPYQITDSLGNLICSRDPNHRIIGYREILANATTTTSAAIAGLSVPIIAPTGRKIKVSVNAGNTYNTGANGGVGLHIFTGATLAALTTRVARSQHYAPTKSANFGLPLRPEVTYIPPAGLNFYTAQIVEIGGVGTATIEAAAGYPVSIIVELV